MLCVTLIGPYIEDITHQIELAIDADLIEFRFDLYDGVTSLQLADICKANRGRLLFTFKKAKQITQFLSLKPDFVDLDASLFETFAPLISKALPDTKIICSKHFSSFFDAMEASKQLLKIPADMIKIAAPAETPIDPFIMKSLSSNSKFIPVCMGEEGQILRILGNKMGIPITYAAADKGLEAADGQLPIHDLVNLYGFKTQKNSKVYGLIGDPVDKSIGHIFHNQFFKQHNLDCVYVKQRLREEDLDLFFKKVAPLFSGLSVTMPLKQKVIPFVGQLTPSAQKIGAINTLAKSTHGWIGTNTDGLGALVALERKVDVKGAKMIVFGTGSTTRSIVYETKRRGAEITIVGRNFEKAKALAKEFEIDVQRVEKIDELLKEKIIFMQTTSCGMKNEPLPFDFSKLSKTSVVFDVLLSSPLLGWAEKNNLPVITGREMFLVQAIEQLKFWEKYEGFDSSITSARVSHAT